MTAGLRAGVAAPGRDGVRCRRDAVPPGIRAGAGRGPECRGRCRGPGPEGLLVSAPVPVLVLVATLVSTLAPGSCRVRDGLGSVAGRGAQPPCSRFVEEGEAGGAIGSRR